jgi:hypothetical protein
MARLYRSSVVGAGESQLCWPHTVDIKSNPPSHTINLSGVQKPEGEEVRSLECCRKCGVLSK